MDWRMDKPNAVRDSVRLGLGPALVKTLQRMRVQVVQNDCNRLGMRIQNVADVREDFHKISGGTSRSCVDSTLAGSGLGYDKQGCCFIALVF